MLESHISFKLAVSPKDRVTSKIITAGSLGRLCHGTNSTLGFPPLKPATDAYLEFGY